jgi:peroxiredoxin
MLGVGDTAPDFELSSYLEKDKKAKLPDLRGKSVLIAFYVLERNDRP